MTRRRSRRNNSPDRSGLGTLLLGFVFTVAGGYLLTNQVEVGAGPFGGFAWFGPNSFGLLLVPLLIGVALLAFDAKLLIGRLIAAGGAVILLVSVLDTLRITFRPTSLFITLLMLGLLIIGLGLMARSIVGVGTRESEGDFELDVREVPVSSAQLPGGTKGSVSSAPASGALAAPRKSVDQELAEIRAKKAQQPNTDSRSI
jgi:hypothetical protein